MIHSHIFIKNIKIQNILSVRNSESSPILTWIKATCYSITSYSECHDSDDWISPPWYMKQRSCATCSMMVPPWLTTVGQPSPPFRFINEAGLIFNQQKRALHEQHRFISFFFCILYSQQYGHCENRLFYSQLNSPGAESFFFFFSFLGL